MSLENNIFEELSKQLALANPELGEFEDLGRLLALPDEKFVVLEPIFSNEIEKSFNNVNDKVAMAASLNASGYKLEDVQRAFLDITNQIDSQFDTILTKPKKDFLKKMLGMAYNAIADTQGIAKRVVQIPIELCHKDAKMPTYANMGDAGLDIYAIDDITIHPGETILVKTGLKIAIPYGYEVQVRPKSGRALKTKFRIANTPGTIDSGYRDEIGVIIDNIEPPIKDIEYDFNEQGQIVIKSILHGSDYHIGKGEKFAQLVLSEVPKASFYQVESVASIDGNRGGGFGSSGLK